MGVLDSVIKLRELDQQQAQANVESMIKGVQASQEAYKTNLLADIERKKIQGDMMTKGLQFNPTTGEAKPLESGLLESIRQANIKPESEMDLYLKQARINEAEAKAKDREIKQEILNDVNTAMNLQETASKEEKEAWLSERNPMVAEMVKGLTDYSIDPSKFASLRTDERTKYLALAKKYDPSFSMVEFPKRQKFLNSISDPSTMAGRNVISLNTLAHHLQTLDEALEANKGSNVVPVQALLNSAREITGNPSITDEKLAMKVVKDEFEKALAGTVTQEALKDFDKIFNPNIGYEAKKQAVKTFVGLAKGRIQPYRDSFKAVMKRDENGEIIFPESQAIFEKYLGSEETAKSAEGGETKTVGGATYKKVDGGWQKIS